MINLKQLSNELLPRFHHLGRDSLRVEPFEVLPDGRVRTILMPMDVDWDVLDIIRKHVAPASPPAGDERRCRCGHLQSEHISCIYTSCGCDEFTVLAALDERG